MWCCVFSRSCNSQSDGSPCFIFCGVPFRRSHFEVTPDPRFQMPAKRPASKVCKRPAAKRRAEPKEAMEDAEIFPSSSDGEAQYQRVKDVRF